MSKKLRNNTLMKGKEKQSCSKSAEVDKLYIAEEIVFCQLALLLFNGVIIKFGKGARKYRT